MRAVMVSGYSIVELLFAVALAVGMFLAVSANTLDWSQTSVFVVCSALVVVASPLAERTEAEPRCNVLSASSVIIPLIPPTESARMVPF